MARKYEILAEMGVAMLLNAVAALRLNRPEKARCITMLAR
jgi:hypothetical protein